MPTDPFQPRWALPLFVVAASVVAFAGLGTKSFWFDEGYSAELAREPLGSWWSLLWSQEAGSIIHAAILKVVASFSDSDVALRTPSALAAVVAAVLTVRLAAHMSHARTALVSGALLIVNGTYVAYAQEARTYSLAMVATLAATLALLREGKQRSAASASLYVLAAVVCVYTHALGVLWLLAHGFYVLLADRTYLRRWALIGAGIVVGCAPLVIGMAIAGYAETQDSAVQPTRDPALFVHVARALLAPGRIAGLLLLATAAGGALRAAIGSQNAPPERSKDTAWLLVVLCVVVPLIAGFATIGLNHPRWFVPIVPFLVVLVAQATPVPHRATLALPAVGLVLLSASGLLNWHLDAEKADARAWSRQLQEQTAGGDTVAFDATFGRIVTEHYLAQRDAGLPNIASSPQPEPFGTYFWQPERDRLGECSLDETRIEELLLDAAPGSLWLVVAEPVGCPTAERLHEHLRDQGLDLTFTGLEGPAAVIEIRTTPPSG